MPERVTRRRFLVVTGAGLSAAALGVTDAEAKSGGCVALGFDPFDFTADNATRTVLVRKPPIQFAEDLAPKPITLQGGGVVWIATWPEASGSISAIGGDEGSRGRL